MEYREPHKTVATKAAELHIVQAEVSENLARGPAADASKVRKIAGRKESGQRVEGPRWRVSEAEEQFIRWIALLLFVQKQTLICNGEPAEDLPAECTLSMKRLEARQDYHNVKSSKRA